MSLPLVGIIAIALVVIAGLALAAKWKMPSPGIAAGVYTKQSCLFTPAERSFLGVLQQAVSDEYAIYGKVRLADVVELKRNLPANVRRSALNRIQAKHLDYVLCDPDIGNPMRRRAR